MKLSWIAIFLLVFFLINVVRFVMAYFGKKLSTVPQVPAVGGVSSEEEGRRVSRDKIGQALMEVVEKKLFPDVANLYDGIKTQGQLDELVDKVTGAMEGVVASAMGVGGKVEELDTEAEEIMEATTLATAPVGTVVDDEEATEKKNV